MSPESRLPPSLAEIDLSGRTLGDFHLLRRLGRGAMAEVYLAEQQRLKRRVAVKILRPELAGDRTYLQRFEIEAQAAASLVHANIVQIYEVGCIGGIHYIAQEYVQGQNLRDYIARHGPPDLAQALSIMRQTAAALAKASEQGVIHRDIKPENIMLAAGGEVKVADFGLARLVGAATNDLTQVGVTLGTPLYMSPEQVEGRTLDARSDIYSLGVTCYHILAGVPPFGGETALGVAVQHLKTRPKPLETLRPDLPPALCRIVHRMLAKDPSQRFASARDLLHELRRVRMEHFGDDWPEDLPAWEPMAAETAVEPRLELTRQLDGLMKAATAAGGHRRQRAWTVTGVVAAAAIGAALAWFTVVPRSPLADAKAAAAATIPKEKNVKRQWYRASQIGTEAAWQSVIRYFPDKEHFALHAEQQLALLYFGEGDYRRAMPIFEKLASLGDDEVELKAFGLAGQCGVLSLEGRYDESNAVLGRLLPLRDKLTSDPMRKLIENAIKRNRSKLGPQTGREWDKWLAEQFHDEG